MKYPLNLYIIILSLMDKFEILKLIFLIIALIGTIIIRLKITKNPLINIAYIIGIVMVYSIIYFFMSGASLSQLFYGLIMVSILIMSLLFMLMEASSGYCNV